MCYKILEPLSNVSKSYEGKISYKYVVVIVVNNKYNATNFMNSDENWVVGTFGLDS